MGINSSVRLPFGVRSSHDLRTVVVRDSSEVVLTGVPFDHDELQRLIESLASDHDDLDVRLRTLSHTLCCDHKDVHIHGHYLAFRDGKPTVSEFVDLLSRKLIPFCLSRKQIAVQQKEWATLSQNKIMERVVALHEKAVDLFKRAQRTTNRNGEFGEVITYLLIERILKAPQMVAKMSLKTSPQMPVQGSDGIHFRFDAAAGSLVLIWGESKCYASVNSAMSEAVKSVSENLQVGKIAHELFLIKEHADFTIFTEEAREAIMSFLDPWDENYNKRVDSSVILIAFDFNKFAALRDLKSTEVEAVFAKELEAELGNCAVRLDSELTKQGMQQHLLDVFFLPVPSIDQLRTMFQDKIGWAA